MRGIKNIMMYCIEKSYDITVKACFRGDVSLENGKEYGCKIYKFIW